MSEHVASNFATYQTNNGAPVFDTFFILSSVAGQLHLFAFESEAQRAAALEHQLSVGKESESVPHHRAYDLIRNGMPAWLFEGGNDDLTTWTPLSLARGPKGSWSPRVIDGGIVAAALD